MAKIQSPLLGYNNNVRHKNRVFHIQTEDSGVKHPHVITHLFMDGGRILKSVKRSYAEHVGSENLSETVRQMMKEQHKQMFIALRDGEYDHLLDGAALAGSGALAAASAGPKTEESPPKASAQASIAPAGNSASSASPTQASLPPAASAATPPTPSKAPPPETSRDAVGIDMQAIEAASMTTGERAALMANDLPPPPKNLFQKDLSGNIGYRSTQVDEEEVQRSGSSPPAQTRRSQGSQPVPDAKRAALGRTQPSVAPASSRGGVSPKPSPVAPPPAPVPPVQSGQSVGPAAGAASSVNGPLTQKDAPKEDPSAAKARRYAPARPAAIFGQSQTPNPSIFGDDLVGDKSLDEVILSYLVDDLSPPKKK
jgi:hypothetical protein